VAADMRARQLYDARGLDGMDICRTCPKRPPMRDRGRQVSDTSTAAAAVPVPLALPHTRCSRCNVWSRRPERCPHCGAGKTAAGSAATGANRSMRQLR
jgi:hypothetical protein